MPTEVNPYTALKLKQWNGAQKAAYIEASKNDHRAMVEMTKDLTGTPNERVIARANLRYHLIYGEGASS